MTKAKNLKLGNKIKISGEVCDIRGINLNTNDAVILSFVYSDMPHPVGYFPKAQKARKAARGTLTVHKNKKLKKVK